MSVITKLDHIDDSSVKINGLLKRLDNLPYKEIGYADDMASLMLKIADFVQGKIHSP